MQTAAVNAPRWDYDPTTLALRGMLIEDQRSNIVKNSTMVGAAAGSPGTDPTGWTVATVGGLTKTIIGSGTESGISYIDYRFNAASSTGGNLNFFMAPTGVSSLPAAASTVYAMSAYLAFEAGSVPAVISFRINSYDSGGGNLGVLSGSNLSGFTVGDPLTKGGRSSVFTATPATTAFVTVFMQIGIPTGAVDFTIRIGAPQLEAGAMASSFIPTSTVAVTRAVDTLGMPNDISFNATAGTWQGEFIPNGSPTVAAVVVSGNAGSPTLTLGVDARLNAGVRAGLTAFSGQGPTFNFGAVNKAAFAYLSGASGAAVNGTAFGPSATAITITGTTVRFGADGINSLAALNGRLRRVRYWPRALGPAELQAVTT
jgi:hypothetical protein